MSIKTLYILRHAKSDWETDAPSDFERPLNKRGRKSAKAMGKWLAENVQQPIQIVSSSALRARQTTMFVANALEIAEEDIILSSDLYLASPKDILQVLSTTPEHNSQILLVGHNPGLEEMLEYLIEEPLPQIVPGKVLPTATVAIVELKEQWNNLKKSCGQLVRIYRPEKK